jgi:hypothetical protein
MSWKITPGWSPADTDAAAYITAVETADNQALENGVKVAIDNFVLGCKADGIWSAIKASCILAGARTLAGALVPLVGTAPTNVGGLFVSGDYNRKTGLVGDGSTKYLNSNRNNNADPQNSFHGSVYASTAATSTSAVFPIYLGVGGGNDGATHFGRANNNGLIFTRCRSGTAINGPANSGSATGLLGINRSNSTNYILRNTLTNTTLTSSSQLPLSNNILVFASAVPSGTGVASGTYANARIAFYSIGESLDLALLDARVTTLVNAFAAAIP